MPEAPLAAQGLLVVVAHPDDESLACGALIARAAALGVRVTIASLTSGEAGPSTGSPGDLPTLGQRRTAELEAAGAVLGATSVVVRGYADGMLPWIKPATIVADVTGLIDATEADVVITFGADGLYWHPDHIAVFEHTTKAVRRLGARAPALYYVTTPPGQMRAVADAAGGLAVVPGPIDPDAFGVAAAPPTLVIPCGRFARTKLTALRCHASQFAGTAFSVLSADDAERLLEVEHLHRAPVGAGGPCWLDTLGAPPPRTPPHA